MIQTHTSQGKSFSKLDYAMMSQELYIIVSEGPITRNKLKKFLEEGDINQGVIDKFYDGIRGPYGCAYKLLC